MNQTSQARRKETMPFSQCRSLMWLRRRIPRSKAITSRVSQMWNLTLLSVSSFVPTLCHTNCAAMKMECLLLKRATLHPHFCMQIWMTLLRGRSITSYGWASSAQNTSWLESSFKKQRECSRKRSATESSTLRKNSSLTCGSMKDLWGQTCTTLSIRRTKIPQYLKTGRTSMRSTRKSHIAYMSWGKS